MCSQVSIIRIQNISKISDKCTKHIPIEFKLAGTDHFQSGYIRENNIITQYTTDSVFDCKQSILVKDSKKNRHLIKKIESKFFVEKFHHHSTDLKIIAGNIKNLYNHHSYLVNGTGIIEQLNEFMIDSSLDNLDQENFYDTNKISSKFNIDRVEIINDPLGTITGWVSNGLHNIFENIKDKIKIFCVFFLIFFAIITFFYYKFVFSKKLSFQNLNSFIENV